MEVFITGVVMLLKVIAGIVVLTVVFVVSMFVLFLFVDKESLYSIGCLPDNDDDDVDNNSK